MAWIANRTWTSEELPWLQAFAREGLEGEPNGTSPDADVPLPWEHLLPTDRILTANDIYPVFDAEVGEIYEAVLASAAWWAVSTMRVFEYADALLAASRGDVDGLTRGIPTGPYLPGATGGFHGPRRLLSRAEIHAAGPTEISNLLPGAIYEAVVDSDALHLPAYAAYQSVQKAARNSLRRDLFGPVGEGIYAQKRLRLDDVDEPPWSPTNEEPDGAALDRVGELLDVLSPAERRAVQAQLGALSEDLSLREWCGIHRLNYGATQRAWARATDRLRAGAENRA